MKPFNIRYKAYTEASKIASRLGSIFSFIVMIIAIGLLFHFNPSILLWIIFVIIILFITGIIDIILKRIFLKIFFKRKLRKM